MVEKPKEGICSVCGSERLEFYDDGTGRCPDCGRTFRWASQEEIEGGPPEPEVSEEPRMQEEPEVSPEPQDEAKTAPSTEPERRSPARVSKPPTSRKESRTFLWIAVVGFIIMMVGYTLIYGLNAVSTMQDDGLENINAYRNIGVMLNFVGVLIVGIGLLIGAVTADQLDDKIRAWLLIAMAILLGLFLSLGSLFLTSV